MRCHGTGVQNDTIYCNWITSLASVPYSDLFASGSADGFVRLWKISSDKKSFEALFKIGIVCFLPNEQHGFINSLEFFNAPESEGDSGLYLAAGVGQEHKFGRWYKDKKAKNCVKVMHL